MSIHLAMGGVDCASISVPAWTDRVVMIDQRTVTEVPRASLLSFGVRKTLMSHEISETEPEGAKQRAVERR